MWPEQPEVDGEAQTIGGSTMATDDLKVAGRQRVETAEVTFGKIGGNAHECIALFNGEQARCLGYDAAGSADVGVMAGSGAGPANLSQYAF